MEALLLLGGSSSVSQKSTTFVVYGAYDMAKFNLIRTTGLFIPLTTEDAMKRAKKLVKKNPAKYLVDSIYPSGAESQTPLIHYVAHAEPGLLIKAWVETGEGTEPNEPTNL